ncbi:unnamed protein product [Spodoptera exigua]|nr:unnamed protein product [Spodoptera exigua]
MHGVNDRSQRKRHTSSPEMCARALRDRRLAIYNHAGRTPRGERDVISLFRSRSLYPHVRPPRETNNFKLYEEEPARFRGASVQQMTVELSCSQECVERGASRTGGRLVGCRLRCRGIVHCASAPPAPPARHQRETGQGLTGAYLTTHCCLPHSSLLHLLSHTYTNTT